MPASAGRRLEWAPRALQAYIESVAHIADEDPRTAALVRERVEHALGLILEHPRIGVSTARRGERRFAIANTGHVIVYRVTAAAVRVHVWYRARQNVHRRLWC
jgi:plasmid stabilization system protein ParE